jgi:hypothetical protein
MQSQRLWVCAGAGAGGVGAGAVVGAAGAVVGAAAAVVGAAAAVVAVVAKGRDSHLTSSDIHPCSTSAHAKVAGLPACPPDATPKYAHVLDSPAVSGACPTAVPKSATIQSKAGSLGVS